MITNPLVERKKVKVAQSCPALCNTMGYTVHRILQARILEWVAFSFSKGSSQPRDRTHVSRIAGRLFTSRVTREAREYRPLVIWEKFKLKTRFYFILKSSLEVGRCQVWVKIWGNRNSPVTMGGCIAWWGHSRIDLAALHPVRFRCSLWPSTDYDLAIPWVHIPGKFWHWFIGEHLEASPQIIVCRKKSFFRSNLNVLTLRSNLSVHCQGNR